MTPATAARPRAALLPLFAALAACGGGGGEEPARLVLTAAERTDLLAAHNDVRAGALPAPSPALPALAWSGELELAAQGWADRCAWGHTPNLGEMGMGQNLAGGSPPDSWSLAGLFAGWADEADWYDLASNGCSPPPGKSCGHYTQLVWRETTEVGCGVATCAPSGPFTEKWKFLVCNYAPPGNWVGERPY